MAKVTEVLIRVTFSEHYYNWGGSVRRQQKGGAIGLHGTGSVARTTMDVWIQRYGLLLAKHGVTVHLLRKYVDDVLIICNNLQLGSRWKAGKVSCDEEDRLEDEQQ